MNWNMAAGITILVVALCSCILIQVPAVASSDGISSVLKWNPWYMEADKLRFASVFGSHMVLQKDRVNRIWGFADSGSVDMKVYLTISGSNTVEYYVSTPTHYSSRESKWSVDIKPQAAGGPYSISVTVASTSVILDDVLFGDVWICSGQSNMQFSASMMINAKEEVALAAKYPNMRVFTAAQVQSSVPLDDLKEVSQQWTRASPESIGGPDWKYFSAVCWEYGRHIYDELQYPVGLIATTWGGTPVEAWSSPDALSKCNTTQAEEERLRSDYIKTIVTGPGGKSVLYNAMIYPFLQLSITGAVWYQGEANEGSPIYDCRFHAMIEDWRSKFFSFSGKHNDQSFPFGFVQLAPNRNSTTLIGGFPTIRWQQTYDVGYVPNSVMQNVFMAVAIDLPDFSSPYGQIHPRDKETVGIRLAKAGLAVAYKHTGIKFQGPFPVSFKKLEENKLLINYGNSSKIEIRGHFGFQVCCGNVDCKNDTVWTVAKINSADVSSVTIQYSCGSAEVNGVRYLWSESPCPYLQCPVYSTDAQLPAPPFVFVKPSVYFL